MNNISGCQEVGEKEFCITCGEPNPPERKVCECGGRHFVYGKKFSLIEDVIHCDCGSTHWRLIIHINRRPVHTYRYTCADCLNTVTVEKYVGPESE